LTIPSATRLPDGQEADGNKTKKQLILLPFTLVNSLPRQVGGFVKCTCTRGFPKGFSKDSDFCPIGKDGIDKHLEQFKITMTRN